jgi:hypothetical protein
MFGGRPGEDWHSQNTPEQEESEAGPKDVLHRGVMGTYHIPKSLVIPGP